MHIADLVKSAEAIGRDSLDRTSSQGTFVLPYVREEYAELARKLQLSPAQPRTAHRGVIITRHPTTHASLLLVDRRQAEGLLTERDQWKPHPGQKVAKGNPGESCDALCR